MKNFDTNQFMKEFTTSDFYLNCGIPMGYSAGIPMLVQKNSTLCLQIPFLKYKVTGEVDKTLVFPIRYIITVSLPDKKCIGFEDLKYNSAFRKVDFNAPIGFFRHDAIKTYSRSEYKAKKAELFSMYDKRISSILSDSEYTKEDARVFSDLLNIMLEPSLKPIYKLLANSFYTKHLV